MGTYVLTQSGANECLFVDSGAQFLCDGYSRFQIRMLFEDDGTNTTLWISVEYGTLSDPDANWVLYKKTFSGRVDCDAFTNEPIPYDSHQEAPIGPGSCDYGATIDDILLTTS